jgi:hypothetical protein
MVGIISCLILKEDPSKYIAKLHLRGGRGRGGDRWQPGLIIGDEVQV